jgi:hypothetical protein
MDGTRPPPVAFSSPAGVIPSGERAPTIIHGTGTQNIAGILSPGETRTNVRPWLLPVRPKEF